MTTFALLAALVALSPQPAQPAGPATPPPPDASEPAPIPPWLEEKLRQLRPSSPEAYFLLGEEAADAAITDPALLPLARQLFALAFELARERGGAPLAASACIALADLERSEANRRWLEAMASTLDRRYDATDWSVPATRAASDETSLKAASVLGLARAGEGKLAQKLYDEPGVAAMLQEFERLISTNEATGAVFRLNKAMQLWPCQECGNERILWGPGDGSPQARLCPTCGGNPGPRLSEEELVAQLRFEASLLSGIQRSWAAQVVSDQGAPLRDPDPAELAPTYGVDPGSPIWRDGRWTPAGGADR